MENPDHNPGDTVTIAKDIEAQIVGCVWDGEGWTYRVSYWHDGEYRCIELLRYEMHKEEQ